MNRLRWLLLTLPLAICGPAFAQSFSRVINFGDSLSDVGNTNSITFGISPGSNYWNGRFSNGPVWAESLAASLGLPATKSSRSGGLDYAVGGSRTGSGNVTPFPFINLPNAGTQINSFLNANTPGANDLVTLWTGANDFLDGQTDPAVPANNVKGHVQQLVNAGVKNILVINLPPLGDTPRYRNTADAAVMTSRAAQFNTSVWAGLDSIAAASPAVTIYRGDMFGLFAQALNRPTDFGFMNVTDPALRADGTVAPNPDQYLFYDTIHPTRAGHTVLAGFAFETVTTRTWSATATGDWSRAANWIEHRVPDVKSAVVVTSSLQPLRPTTDVTVRKLRFGAASSAGGELDLGLNRLHVLDALDSTGGTLSVDLDSSAGPRITVGGQAKLGGTLRVGFATGFIGLPGTSEAIMSFASHVGEPTIENATGFAGLLISPRATDSTLLVDFSAAPGDSDLNALVDFIDLVTLAQHYNQSAGQTWLDGDFNGDAGVGFDDLVILAQHYGSPMAFDADWTLAQSLVPEPAVAVLFIACIRRRRIIAA